MKTKYLLLIWVFFCLLPVTKGQHGLHGLSSYNGHTLRDPDSFTDKEGFFGPSRYDTIWYENFDGGLPETWVVIDKNNFCTFHHTYDGPQGPYSAGIGPLQSTTAHNGFMIIDSDLCNSGNNNDPDTVDAFMQTPVIDMSEYENVLLNFEHSFRYLYSFEHSLLQVLVSNDSINWVPYDVRNGIQPNHISPNPVNQTLDISDVAGGEEAVWIRFHKVNATYYYWMIDDVSLIGFDESEIKIESVQYGGYSLMPGGQEIPLYLSANVINEGSIPVCDVVLDVDINKFLFNQSTEISEIQPGQEVELPIAVPFIPVNKGKYNVLFSISHELFSGEQIKIIREATFWVTDTVFSRDDNIYSEGISAAPGEPFITGNRYDILSTVEATSAGVVLHHQTQPGAQIKALIYEMKDGEFLLLAESDEYIVQDSDIPAYYNGDPVSVILPFTEPVVLEPENHYLAAFEHAGGDDTAVIAGSTGIDQPPDASYTYTQGTWKSEDVTPFVRLHFGNNEAECEILLEFTTENAYCGEANGSATVHPLTGNPPFTYVWDTDPVQTSQTATDLSEGIYYVTVADSYGYEASGEVEIYDMGGTMPEVEHMIIEPTGCGNSNGAIFIYPKDPKAQYYYYWSTGHTSKTLNNISAGTYMLTVTEPTDKCQLHLSFYVNDSDAPDIVADITNVSCYGHSDGAIAITLEGEVYDPVFNWSTGDTGNTIENLEAGTYSLTVTDSGCMCMEDFEVTQPDQLFVSFDVTEPLCHGENTGQVIALITGGTSPYYYNWSTGGTDQSITNIAAGKYYVTVTDANYCMKEDSVLVGDPPEIIIEADTIIHPSTGKNNGAIYLSVSGGTGNYEFMWNHGPTTKNVTGLPAGIYEVTVIDDNGCTQTKFFILEEVYVNELFSADNIAVYPNPATDFTTIQFKAVQGTVNIYLKDMHGKKVFEDSTLITGKNSLYEVNTSGLKPGIYIIVIEMPESKVSLKLMVY